MEGPPGLAKTRAVNALAKGLEGDFHQQFTPDLPPADSPERIYTDQKPAPLNSKRTALSQFNFG